MADSAVALVPASTSAASLTASPTRRKRISQLIAAPLVALSLFAAGFGAVGGARANGPEHDPAQLMGAKPGAEIVAAITGSKALESETLQASVPVTAAQTLQNAPENAHQLRVLGVPHAIRRGETLESVAEVYRVPVEDIIGFAENELVAGAPLPEGLEIFIPGATPLLPSSGVVSRREVEPSGLVVDGRSNVRQGPGIAYRRVGQLDGGRYVKLLGKYKGWYKVEYRSNRTGWMSADVLTVPGYVQASLPEATDFPPRPTWVWPADGRFTSGYGWREEPWRMFHDGIDIANAEGAPLYAVRDGTILAAGWCSGYGYCVIIEHADGFESHYGHLMTQPTVRVGEKVEAGQVVGLLGNTYDLAGGGYSSGPHLHLTLKKDGQAIDPLQYLPRP